MHDFLKRRLASADALIYVGANGVRHFSAIHSPLEDDIKLEIMTAWANDDLTGEVEDVIPFAKAFESLIGPYIKTDYKLQDNCIKIFGMWAPNLRTKLYKEDTPGGPGGAACLVPELPGAACLAPELGPGRGGPVSAVCLVPDGLVPLVAPGKGGCCC